MDIDMTVNNDFCREKGRLNGLLLVEGATQAPVNSNVADGKQCEAIGEWILI